MSKIRSILGFPAILLLLILPMSFLLKGGTIDLAMHDTYFVIGLLPFFSAMTLIMAVSWIFHVWLRMRYEGRHFAVGAWIQVGLSVGCWFLLLFSLYKQDLLFSHIRAGVTQDLYFNVLHGPHWNSIGITAFLVLLLLQVLFWPVAVYGLLRRRRVVIDAAD